MFWDRKNDFSTLSVLFSTLFLDFWISRTFLDIIRENIRENSMVHRPFSFFSTCRNSGVSISTHVLWRLKDLKTQIVMVSHKVCLCWARNVSVLLTSNKPSKFIVCLPSSALESMANAVSRFQIVYTKSRQRYGPAFKAYRSTQI